MLTRTPLHPERRQEEMSPQASTLTRCERAILMVEKHLQDIHLGTTAVAASDTSATDPSHGPTPDSAVKLQRDRVLAKCVLDCDYIYEALDRVSADGDAGGCNSKY